VLHRSVDEALEFGERRVVPFAVIRIEVGFGEGDDFVGLPPQLPPTDSDGPAVWVVDLAAGQA
jgi:hypothetical protein